MSAEKQEQRTVALRDGHPVLLRALRAQDRDLVLESFQRLSERSRYRRFFLRLKTLPEPLLDALLDVDHHDREAIAAISPASGQLLGVARYGRSPEDPVTAELAVSVADDWQGRGLGSLLLDRLAERAREEGIERFSASVLGENPEALGLLAKIGPASHRVEGGVIELVVELPPERGAGPRLAAMLRALATEALLPARTLAEHLAVQLTPSGAPVVSGERIRTIVVRAAPADAAALATAVRLAGALRASLHVLVGSAPDPGPELLERERLAAGSDELDPQLHVRGGDPAAALVWLAREQRADLLVVGAAKPDASVSARARRLVDWVSRNAPCSVLLVHASPGPVKDR